MCPIWRSNWPRVNFCRTTDYITLCWGVFRQITHFKLKGVCVFPWHNAISWSLRFSILSQIRMRWDWMPHFATQTQTHLFCSHSAVSFILGWPGHLESNTLHFYYWSVRHECTDTEAALYGSETLTDWYATHMNITGESLCTTSY